jgi:hypothetical protein
MKDRVRGRLQLLGPGIKERTRSTSSPARGRWKRSNQPGAERATMIERHLPTVKLIRQSAAALGVAEQVEVVFGDAFGWSESLLTIADAGDGILFSSVRLLR